MIFEAAKKREEIEERKREKKGGEKFKSMNRSILGVQINQEGQQY